VFQTDNKERSTETNKNVEEKQNRKEIKTIRQQVMHEFVYEGIKGTTNQIKEMAERVQDSA
jgi:hypothetical protein